MSEAALAKVALGYLERYAASRTALERRLERWVKERGDPPDVAAARPLIAELISRYERSRLVDDGRLAEHLLDSARARGQSRLAIERRLAARGVAPSAIERAVQSEREASGNAELLAAKRLVQKRRLGPFRPEAERAANRRRDLAVLARAGFDFDTAVSALGSHRDDEF